MSGSLDVSVDLDLKEQRRRRERQLLERRELATHETPRYVLGCVGGRPCGAGRV